MLVFAAVDGDGVAEDAGGAALDAEDLVGPDEAVCGDGGVSDDGDGVDLERRGARGGDEAAEDGGLLGAGEGCGRGEEDEEDDDGGAWAAVYASWPYVRMEWVPGE